MKEITELQNEIEELRSTLYILESKGYSPKTYDEIAELRDIIRQKEVKIHTLYNEMK